MTWLHPPRCSKPLMPCRRSWTKPRQSLAHPQYYPLQTPRYAYHFNIYLPFFTKNVTDSPEWKINSEIRGDKINLRFLPLPSSSITQVMSLCRLFFVRFEGNSILPKSPKLDFFPWNSIFRQFWSNSTLQNIIWNKNLHGWPFLLHFYYQNLGKRGFF